MNESIKKNDSHFWAWLAGFIDGDGSIGFYAGGHGQPKCSVQIAQKDRAILDLIVGRVGSGSVHIQSIVERPGQPAVAYHALHFGSKASRQLCAKLLPHLRDPGKRDRAARSQAWERLKPGEIANSPEKNPNFEDVVSLYTSGLSSSEVEAMTGVPQKTALRWVARSGKVRSSSVAAAMRGKAMRGKQKTTKNSAAREKAIERRREGWTQEAIAIEAGVHINTVRYWLKVAEKQEPPK